VVLVHDHRNFGASDGAIRHDIDPWCQIADWRRAISFLESKPNVDPGRMGIWGTSYAGGHVLVLGATDRRIRAVVSQVPTISGYQQGLRRVAPDAVEALERQFDEDERARDGPKAAVAWTSVKTVDNHLMTVREKFKIDDTGICLSESYKRGLIKY